MRKFYAARNDFGSETSTGYANTWKVFAFSSKRARDAWIKWAGKYDISVHAIKRAEIKNYVERPKPFTCQLRAILPDYIFGCQIEGLIGIVTTCYPGDYICQI